MPAGGAAEDWPLALTCMEGKIQATTACWNLGGLLEHFFTYVQYIYIYVTIYASVYTYIYIYR